MSAVIKNKIHTARKSHVCDSCGGYIWEGMKYRRLYGSAHSSEPVRELKLCSSCTDIADTKNDGHIDIMFAG